MVEFESMRVEMLEAGQGGELVLLAGLARSSRPRCAAEPISVEGFDGQDRHHVAHLAAFLAVDPLVRRGLIDFGLMLQLTETGRAFAEHVMQQGVVADALGDEVFTAGYVPSGIDRAFAEVVACTPPTA